MHGGGTRMGNTKTDKPTRLLDITRLVSRAGKRLTGVDRVELAYLERFVCDPVPAYFIVATSIGYILLDKAGASDFRDALVTGEWPERSVFSRFFRKQTKEMQAALTLLRASAVDKSSRTAVNRMLMRNFLPGLEYYNVGHSNYRVGLLDALKTVLGAKIIVMIHDAIPVEYPEFHAPAAVRRFRKKLEIASKYADRVISISNAACESVAKVLEETGRVPEILRAYIGLTKFQPKYANFPEAIDLTRPYYVTVGTIEPRKNHNLLLDVWQELPENGPQLVICGTRGWMNTSLFERLDAGARNVIELPNLKDETIAAVIAESQGLLFPTFAEGFGLPPVEALSLGVPVYCSDLPVFYEVLGEAAVYLPKGNYKAWLRTLKETPNGNANKVQIEKFVAPTWDEHFNIVLS